jgi:hypothetical protein
MASDETALLLRVAQQTAHGDLDPLVQLFLRRYGPHRAHALLERASELLAHAAVLALSCTDSTDITDMPDAMGPEPRGERSRP